MGVFVSEVLAEFTEPVVDEDGVAYRAQAAAAARADGIWEGWIEFIPITGGAPLRTPRETTQPSHGDAVYWATGLTGVYLAGALDRALKPLIQHVAAPPQPIFDEPAPSVVRQVEVPVTDAIVDPFEVYENGGEERLRTTLTSLEAWHLVNIILAYNLSEEPRTLLEELSGSSLIEIIIGAVRALGR
jgi:hypothetical protein